MMILLVTLFVLVQSVLQVYPAQLLPQVEWWKWRAEHGRNYMTTAEEMYRRDTWLNNYNYIEKHNSKNGAMQLSLNQFADMVCYQSHHQISHSIYNHTNHTCHADSEGV